MDELIFLYGIAFALNNGLLKIHTSKIYILELPFLRGWIQ